jgi:hypothetical protein
MSEATTEQVKEFMTYPEKTLDGSEPSRCIDGRPDPESPQGPQMPGGFVFPLLLKAINENDYFDGAAIERGLDQLRKSGFVIGTHRGSHRNPESGKSDCAFIDNLGLIIRNAKEQKEKIIEKLKNTKGINTDTLDASYEAILNYDLSKIVISGEKLVKCSEDNKANIENLEGIHQEQVAFVNTKEDTTLDTQEINKLGKQAFNLDQWAVVRQGKAIIANIKEAALKDQALIIYQSILMVLGKPDLPIMLHR